LQQDKAYYFKKLNSQVILRGTLLIVTEHSDSALSYLAAQQGMRDRRHLGSFRQQLGYLLTSRERLLLKKALQIYAERR